jgi:class 3 adenylate cyclase
MRQQQFLSESSDAVVARQMATTIASFLPTGLLEQLFSAITHETSNPRVPKEQEGIYLCLRMSGLHSLLELPAPPEQIEDRLKEVFRSVVDGVEEFGGQLIRMTGETALAVWPIADNHVEALHGGHPRQEVRQAVTRASECAHALLDHLHEMCLWSAGSREIEAHAGHRAPRRTSDTATIASSTSVQQPRMKSRSLWVGAKAAARSTISDTSDPPKAGLGKGRSSGLGSGRNTFFHAARAVGDPNSTDFRLKFGASLTRARTQVMHLGGANGRWEYVVSAPALATAHRILARADAGELLVSDTLWSLFSPSSLQPHVQLDDWKRCPPGKEASSSGTDEGAARRMLLGSLPLAAMRSYVPGPIWAKTLAGDAQWLCTSDQRIVTILCIRMWPPDNAPLSSQLAAYTSAASLTQRALYKIQGTFKHMVQDEEGCTVLACLGLPPFEHSEVACAHGGLTAAIDIRHELTKMGMHSRAVVLSGKVWIGAVGSDSRREYVVVGQPVQLASQMLSFTTEDQAILVDGSTSQANSARHNFTALPFTICMPGQLKHHAMLAIKESRPVEKMSQAPTLTFAVAKWLRSHNKHTGTTTLAHGQLSDSAIQQLRECFQELDDDGSGDISITELLDAVRAVDTAEDGTANSLRAKVRRMMRDVDRDGSGTISFDEFVSMAASTSDSSEALYEEPQNTQDLPLLLTAHTTRKRVHRKLGESFKGSYTTPRQPAVVTRQEPLPAAGHGATCGRRPVNWRRADRIETISAVLDSAEDRANAIARRASAKAASQGPCTKPGLKSRALQNLSDETEVIYAQYRAMRSKLGPPRDRAGHLAAILSPRVRINGYSRPLATSQRTASTSIDNAMQPATTQRSGFAPTHVKLMSDDGNHSPQLTRQPAARIPRLLLEAGQDHAPDAGTDLRKTPGSVPARDEDPMDNLSARDLHPSPRHPRGLAFKPLKPRAASDLSIAVDGGDARGSFPGPRASALPAAKILPRRAYSTAPPSLQLPNCERKQAIGSDEEGWRRGSQWEENGYQGAHALRRGTARDHHDHCAPHSRSVSAWQKELRHGQRMRLVGSETCKSGRSGQQLRLYAFQCLRDTYATNGPGRMSTEFELGPFGRVGLSLGSPPHTPADERAMREWTGAPDVSDADVQALTTAKRAYAHMSSVDELSGDEQRAWLQEPFERSSFAPIVDILEFHGMAEEFRLAGAPGLPGPLVPAAEDVEHGACPERDLVEATNKQSSLDELLV